MSPEYIEAIGIADQAIGLILETLETTAMRNSTALILQSDHGGEGFTHTTGAPADTIIPWLINGPGIKRGHTIEQPVHITDTAATIAHLLDIQPPREWSGKPVLEALQ
jgi:arylsulfatase A-like enzyme